MTRGEAAVILRAHVGLPQVHRLETHPESTNQKVKEAIIEGIQSLEDAEKFLIAKKEVKKPVEVFKPPVIAAPAAK